MNQGEVQRRKISKKPVINFKQTQGELPVELMITGIQPTNKMVMTEENDAEKDQLNINNKFNI